MHAPSVHFIGSVVTDVDGHQLINNNSQNTVHPEYEDILYLTSTNYRKFTTQNSNFGSL